MQKRILVRNWIGTLAVMVAALGVTENVTLAQAGPGYLASTWSDQSVHVLSTQLDNLGSFSAGSTNPNGNTLFTLPNAAVGAPFGGTGITSSGPDELTLAGADGSWWKVSKADGGVLDSGFNGWDMYGLSFIIPEPASLCLFGVGALVLLRRRRRF